MSLFSRIQPKLKDGITVPRDFSDYTITIDESNLPASVKLQRLVG